MSSLYRARVDRVTAPKARLTVWQIHPDAGPPPESISFALALICWPFDRVFVLAGKAPSARAPLAQAVDIEEGDYADEAWVRENARAFIKQFTCKAARDGAAGGSVPWPETGPRYDRHLDELPRAEFELEATDPAWVAHLTRGLTWRTAAYDMGDANPAEPRHPGGQTPGDAARGTERPAERATGASSRYLEFVQGSSSKYWEVTLQGKSLVTRWGRIGARGGEKKETFTTAAEARGALEKLVAGKLAKGYRDASRRSSGPTRPRASRGRTRPRRSRSS